MYVENRTKIANFHTPRVFACVCMYVCVLTVFIYLFIYFLNVWVLLPFDGEIKMYIFNAPDEGVPLGVWYRHKGS